MAVSGAGRFSGTSLRTVVQKLLEFAPLSLAEPWDNVGLLLEPYRDRLISRILLTNDLTEDVLDEALQISANLIISYHPPIFAALKKITSSTWKERIVAACMAHDIAVFSPHTSWDAVTGGVNDWLASAFEYENIKPLHGENQLSEKRSECILTVETRNHDQFSSLLQELSLERMETEFKILLSEKSAVDEGVLKFTAQCSEKALKVVAPLLQKSDSISYYYATPRLMFIEKPVVLEGCGRICQLKAPTSIRDAVTKLKSHLGIPYVQLALARNTTEDDTVQTIAFVAGSGASLLKNIRCDLKITGEASHHEVLEWIHTGSSVVLTNHSNSERGFLRKFKEILSSMLPENSVEIIVSGRDTDPLTVR